MVSSSVPGRAAAVCLERPGRVVEREGETVVRFPPECGAGGPGTSGCQGCSSFARTPEIALARLVVHESLDPGDPVTLTVPAAAVTRVACLLFAVPLAALVLGAWLGEAAAGQLGLEANLSAGLLGLALLAAAMVGAAGRGGAMASELPLTVHRNLKTDTGQRSKCPEE